MRAANMVTKVWEPDGKQRVDSFAAFRRTVDKFIAPRAGECNRFLFRGAPKKEYN